MLGTLLSVLQIMTEVTLWRGGDHWLRKHTKVSLAEEIRKRLQLIISSARTSDPNPYKDSTNEQA